MPGLPGSGEMIASVLDELADPPVNTHVALVMALFFKMY